VVGTMVISKEEKKKILNYLKSNIENNLFVSEYYEKEENKV
jgi:hypothetical protein